MSKIYKKIISIQSEIDMLRCDKCGKETSVACAIDLWCIIEGNNYCFSCQKQHEVGWFNPKTNVNENNK